MAIGSVSGTSFMPPTPSVSWAAPAGSRQGATAPPVSGDQVSLSNLHATPQPTAAEVDERAPALEIPVHDNATLHVALPRGTPLGLGGLSLQDLDAGLQLGPNGTLLMEQPELGALAATTATQAAGPDAAAVRDSSRAALVASLGASLTEAGAGAGAVLDMVSSCFKPAEFASLNSGCYHDASHPVNVAALAGDVASGLGMSRADQSFLQQVALLHDADHRTDANGTVKTGTPARVFATLEWMDQNQADLKDRFGWSDGQFTRAQALIARTDFPFDDKPRSIGSSYDGKSPVQVYEGLLARIPAEERGQVMVQGTALRFADQLGNYVGTFEQAQGAVRGLASEIGLPYEKLAPATPGFMTSAGTDLDHDRAIAGRLGIQVELPTRDLLEARMSPGLRQNLQDNLRQFS